VRRLKHLSFAVAALACTAASSGEQPKLAKRVLKHPATARHVELARAESGPLAGDSQLGFPSDRPSRAMSVGRPNRGSLYNGVLMVDGPHWVVVNPERAWGTEETLASLASAIESVNRTFPDSPKLYVGDISGHRGGYIRPHHSHQSGRDVDLGLYYSKGSAWFVRARADNLDRPRSWALLRALIDDPNVEVVFVDRSIQKLLREYAESAGESRERLDALFEPKSAFSDKLVRHEWGHLTHFHVRFKCPNAVEAGERAAREVALVQRGGRAQYY
jgi:murein endopeptidase